MADEEEEIIEEGGAEEEPQADAEVEAEVEPEAEERPRKSGRFAAAPAGGSKLDLFTVLLMAASAAFLISIVLAGSELHDFYDVQFYIFSKK